MAAALRTRIPRGAAALRTALAAAAAAIALAYVALGAGHAWDFETYYHAAAAWRAGLDPYELESLGIMAGESVALPYLYPPCTLLLFLPFTLLPVGVAALIWLVLKCALAAFLIGVVWRGYVRPVPPEFFVVAALLGFDLALLWDLRTGNVALVEWGLLWLGFASYVRERYVQAALLIAAAAVFKIYPILFLLLLVGPRSGRREATAAAAGLLLFAALLAVPLASHGSWLSALGSAAEEARPALGVDPSALGLLGAAAPLLANVTRLEITGPVLFSVYALALVALSAGAIARAWSGAPSRARVVTAVLLWFLLSPRVMVYSYASALAPAAYALHRGGASGFVRAAAAVLILAPGAWRLLPGRPPGWLGATSFLVLLGAWVLWTRNRGAGAAEP